MVVRVVEAEERPLAAPVVGRSGPQCGNPALTDTHPDFMRLLCWHVTLSSAEDIFDHWQFVRNFGIHQRP